MALLTHFNNENKVITTGLRISYNCEIEHGHWEWQQTPSVKQIYNSDFKITRTANYSYRYVGMDKTTATNCKTYFDNKFKRTTKISQWDGNNGTFADVNGGTLQMADVKMVLHDGTMYDCTIEVQEVDTRMRITEPSNLSSLFITENQRSYDFIGE